MLAPRPARRLVPALLAAGLAALLAPAGAGAVLIPAEPVDGPSADIRTAGDVDVAEDGTGGLVYVKRVGGVDHVFLSVLAGGAFRPPLQLDAGQPAASSRPTIAAGDGGRLVVAWENAGRVRTAIRVSAASGFVAGDAIGAGGAPSLDMSQHGVGWLAFTTRGGGGDDVRLARLASGATAWSVLPGVADETPARDAATPRVAASSDGTAVAAWVEGGVVAVRRGVHTRLGSVARVASLSSLGGLPGGGAGEVDLAVSDDANRAWIAFRQTFGTGLAARPRAVVRLFRGSDLDPVQTLDGQGPNGGAPTSSPRIALDGRGDGFVTFRNGAGNLVSATRFDNDVPGQTFGVSGAPSTTDPRPVVTYARSQIGLFAWRRQVSAGTSEVRARLLQDDLLGDETTLSRGTFGDVDPSAGLDAAADRRGDTAVAFVQGTGANRRLVVAVFDRPPDSMRAQTTDGWIADARPTLVWRRAQESWGPVTYRVTVDGVLVATTTGDRVRLAQPLTDGVHRWQVTGTDRRGQGVAPAARPLRIDTVAPTVRVRVRGRKLAGRPLRFLVEAADGPEGAAVSGVARIRIRFGDRTPAAEGERIRHVFRRAGRYRPRIQVTDRAGNSAVVRVSVRIRAPRRGGDGDRR